MIRHFLSLKSQIMLILVFSLVGCTSPNTSVASQPVSVDNPNPEALTSTPVPEIMVGVVNVDILSSSRKGLNMVNLVPTKETSANVQAQCQDYPNKPF